MVFFLKLHSLTFDCSGSSLLCIGFLQLWQMGGYSLVAVLGLLIALASLVVEHGLWDVQALVVSACRLICPMACGILPGQGLNPCFLHWQVDSYPLCHQGNPVFFSCPVILGFPRNHKMSTEIQVEIFIAWQVVETKGFVSVLYLSLLASPFSVYWCVSP